jgi:hypothetical protein
MAMDTDNLATLDELSERLGAPAAGTLEAMAPASARERFIARGRQIKSSRIITDVARLYGYAYSYWSKATAAERSALVGFSEELLRLAVDRAVALRDADLGHEGATHDEKVALRSRTGAATEALTQGLGLRDQARTALRTVTMADPKLRDALHAAEGTELSGAEAVAASLERIAAFGQQLAASPEAALAARLALTGLTAGYLAGLAAAGAKVRETARAADVRLNVKKVSQADLDYLDGLNLELLGHIIAAFEVAHGLNSAVPRLAPIATRRMLGGHRKAKTPAPAAAPADVPTP